MRPDPVIHVALLVETSSAHARGVIRGVAEFARRQPQWALQLHGGDPAADGSRWLGSWRGQGIIARLESKAITRAVLRAGVPVVNVSGSTSPRGVPRVDTDNEEVCRLAAESFGTRGYRHYAYCGFAHIEWSAWRRDLFTRLLARRRHGCAVFEMEDAARSRRDLRDWLSRLPKPVALLAANDLCGRAVLEACAAEGIEVPGQVAVLGVDDDDLLCRLSRPQLSSIEPDTEGIGFLAAQTLHEMLQGAPATGDRFVPPLRVNSRESTDAAAVADWHVSQALRYIHANALRGIGVADVVTQAQSSRRFLEQRFRRLTGRSIYEEILRLRLEAAQRLLRTTRLPLKDVAQRSGFSRADYLSGLFRERFGVSPRDFRREALAGPHEKPLGV